ncbi:hypothetical protein F5Y14DRAFT_429016 [Nemania sp. NC0429]|nr:hypothetical protein F5Y14DRAFT_429016 [Nemania sp. NC0429]
MQFLLKRYRNLEYNTAINQRCTGFPKNAGFNNGLPALQPDFIQGIGAINFAPFPVEQYIEGSTLHDSYSAVTLPHIVGEMKGTDGILKHARIQAALDGASLVYARNRALEYLGEQVPSSDAEVISFITEGSVLKIHAHYASREKDGSDKYHQFLVQAYLLDFYNQFKECRIGLRNAQDYAKEQSFLLRDRLKQRWTEYSLSRDQLREQWEATKTKDMPAGQAQDVPPLTPSTKPAPLPKKSKATRRGRGKKAPLLKQPAGISKRTSSAKLPTRRSARLAKAKA